MRKHKQGQNVITNGGMVGWHPAKLPNRCGVTLYLAGRSRLTGRGTWKTKWRSKTRLDTAIAKNIRSQNCRLRNTPCAIHGRALRNRIAENTKEFGEKCRWVVPAITMCKRSLGRGKVDAAEPKLFKQHWSPHTLSAFMITHQRSEGKIYGQPPAHADQPQNEARQE